MRSILLFSLLAFATNLIAKPVPTGAQAHLELKQLPVQFEYLIDSSGLKTLEIVQAQRAQFKPLQSQPLDLGIQKGSVWIKINRLPQENRYADSYIVVDKIHLRNIDYYEVTDSKVLRHVSSGTDTPFRTKDVAIPQWAFKVTPGIGNGDVYLKLSSRSPMQLNLSVQSASDLMQYANRHTLYYSIVLGFFLLLSLISSAVAYMTRQRVMWFGLLLMLGAFLEILSSSGLGFAYIWPDLPAINPILSRTAINITLGATGLFCVEYLKSTDFAPKMAKTSQLACTFLILLSTVPMAAISPAVLILSLILVIASSIACITLSLMQQVRGSALLLIGFLIFLTTSITPILASFKLLPAAAKYDVIFDTGLILMSLAMAYSLVLRIRDQTLESAASTEGLKAKTLFFASVSHELRTPINGVIGMLNLMMKDTLSEPQKRLAVYAKSSAESLLCLINDILDISKIEAGKLDVELIEFDVISLFEETIESFAYLEANKHLSLILDTSTLSHTKIVSDPARLRQILNNLIGNALKFTQEGEVEVSVSEMVSPDDHQLVVSIRDTGIGIAAEQLPKLFDNFTQADQSTTRKFGGTGLGLSIAKQLCELLGGKISARSKPGSGSVFSFSLSVEKGRSEPSQLPQPLLSKSVALFHENDSAARVADSYLTKWGARVTRCKTMKEFLKVLIIKQPEFAFSSNAPTNIQRSKIDPTSQPDHHSPFALPLGNCITENKLKRLTSSSQNSVQSRNDNNTDTHKTFKLLLVEDNFINTEVALGMLEDEGYNDIEHAENGQQAIDRLKKENYDLVLMDCQMPILDGYETTQKIRSGNAGKNKDVPVIAMTANAMQGDKEKCLAVGMNDYITKPIDPDKLSYTLQSWLPG